MAGNIKGITIEIGGDSTELQKALQKPEKDAKSLQKELREINNSLKFNPDSLELLAQKSTVLGQEIAAVSEKLRVLRDSQSQVQTQAASGEIGEEQYRAFNREVEKTADQLNTLKTQLQDNGKEITRVGESTGEAAKGSQAYQRAIDEQRKATDKAKESSAEHGKSVQKLKDDYKDAEKGALTFGDAVKASTIGHLFAEGIQKAASALWDFAKAGAASARELEVNERKLELILRNTVSATDDYINSVKELIAQEEQLGVVSGHTQTAASQELATYVTRKGALEKLIPVMNDMIAQQYGVNASQQSGVSVATALGKTLDGQVGSLQRWGYRFSEAEQNILKTGSEMRKLEVITRVVTDSVGGLSHGLRETTEEGRMFGTVLNLEATQRKFGTSVERIKNSLLIQLLPSFTKAIDGIDEALTRNEATIQNVGTIVATVANALSNLIQLITSIPAPVLAMVAGIILAVSAFSSVEKGLGAFNNILGIFNAKLSPTTIKILALVAAVSVLLFLILSLKEGTDAAATSMERAGRSAGSFANQNVGTGSRGYATGTNSARRGLAWVGEDGPELVRFRGGEQVYTAAQSTRKAAEGGNISPDSTYNDYSTMNVTVNGIRELDELVDWWNNKRPRERAAGMGV